MSHAKTIRDLARQALGERNEVLRAKEAEEAKRRAQEQAERRARILDVVVPLWHRRLGEDTPFPEDMIVDEGIYNNDYPDSGWVVLRLETAGTTSTSLYLRVAVQSDGLPERIGVVTRNAERTGAAWSHRRVIDDLADLGEALNPDEVYRPTT